ncbi:DUF6221 family protein [Streptomyces sp. NPDC006640]|uniref:DUF6221 family protein n=1 Tax=unclassified Streptomyces TaxID=2593676 RepID=UPI0036C6FE9C
MDELTRWLGEQLDEDERIAKAVDEEEQSWDPGDKSLGSAVIGAEYGAPVVVGPYDHLDWTVREFIAEHDPARVLCEVEAKREALAHYERIRLHTRQDDEAYVLAEGAVSKQIQIMATAYADRPGYREEWRPS